MFGVGRGRLGELEQRLDRFVDGHPHVLVTVLEGVTPRRRTDIGGSGTLSSG